MITIGILVVLVAALSFRAHDGAGRDSYRPCSQNVLAGPLNRAVAAFGFIVFTMLVVQPAGWALCPAGHPHRLDTRPAALFFHTPDGASFVHSDGAHPKCFGLEWVQGRRARGLESSGNRGQTQAMTYKYLILYRMPVQRWAQLLPSDWNTVMSIARALPSVAKMREARDGALVAVMGAASAQVAP
ncbi:MAG: hypothetical protein JWM53_6424 [bacterium]|nr:hypothetical protein [bacterium]